MTSSRNSLVIGTRGSKLSLVQTNYVVQILRQANPKIDIKIATISTSPDIRYQAPLGSFQRGMFVKELELALLDGRADIAVHSLKDLPTQMPHGLTIGAISEREDPRDVLISPNRAHLSDLPVAAVIGTSSSRRASQLRFLRRDLTIKPIRGNVDSRIQKMRDGQFDAIVVAAAGISRLNRNDEVSQYFRTTELIPPPGQGALAIETRSSDVWIQDLLKSVNHEPSEKAVTAERSFLAHLGGGCSVPVAAYAEIRANDLKISGLICNENGDQRFSEEIIGSLTDPQALGIKLAKDLLDMGANAIV
tara:strand:+ start:3785 stop:4699 length:915 start_codon:yes stop_codon:yes gene_type:complete